jgi:hypothetical protein
LATTGIDPRRLQYGDHRQRAAQLAFLMGNPAELTSLIPILARVLEPKQERRATLAELADATTQAIDALKRMTPAHANTVPVRQHAPRNQGRWQAVLERAQIGIMAGCPRDADGLWLSLSLDEESENSTVDDLRRLRSAHRGVAGVVYAASRLARHGWCDVALRRAASHAACWLLDDDVTEDARMPGLHFGEAGVAVALHEAAEAGLTPDSTCGRDDIRRRLSSGELDWPDITHGAAGQGVAALICAPDLAARCIDYLVSTQDADGTWAIPGGLNGIAGEKLTGFAHGTAGIIYFLAAAAGRRENSAAESAWRAGERWLAEHCDVDAAGVINWPYSVNKKEQWKWWCHGAPGIALTYLSLFEQTREHRYLEIACAALEVHPVALRHGNLGQCHGLSGLGEIYLEAFYQSGDERWLDRAIEIANTILMFAKEDRSGGLTWLADHPSIPVADLYVGSAGILHFFLRLAAGPERIGFPLLLERPTQRAPAH